MFDLEEFRHAVARLEVLIQAVASHPERLSREDAASLFVDFGDLRRECEAKRIMLEDRLQDRRAS